MAVKTRIFMLFLLVLTTALFAGCRNTETNKITQRNVETIKEGMTQAQVVAILGKPTGTTFFGSEKKEALVWRGHSLKVIAGFDENGKLSVMIPALITPSPLSVAEARQSCPILLPDRATDIQYAEWGFWIAHETYVRFKAPTSDCMEHARKIMQSCAEETHGTMISANANTAPKGFPPTNGMLDVRWFDLDRFAGGVVFSLSNSPGPAVWVDTNRQYFYFIDED
jgi:hypothetical protein